MIVFNKEMCDALEADGEKLRQLTGEDHGPIFLAEEPGDDLLIASATLLHNQALEAAAKIADAEHKRLDAEAIRWMKDPDVPVSPCFTAGAIASRRIAEGIRALKR
jgi:hypothetical protein